MHPGPSGGSKEFVASPEAGECDTSRRADSRARSDAGASAGPGREQGVGKLVEEFRREDRATTLVLASSFIALFAVLAVWTWHYSL